MILNEVRYVHFTSPEHAQDIQKSGKLLPSSYVGGGNAVFAVVAGGRYVPGVQQSYHGRTKDRSVAVIFSSSEIPDTAFPEEVIWHLPSLPISDIKIVPAQEGIKLLDGSIPEKPDGTLDIETHPSTRNDNLDTIRLEEYLRGVVSSYLSEYDHRHQHSRKNSR